MQQNDGASLGIDNCAGIGTSIDPALLSFQLDGYLLPLSEVFDRLFQHKIAVSDRHPTEQQGREADTMSHGVWFCGLVRLAVGVTLRNFGCDPPVYFWKFTFLQVGTEPNKRELPKIDRWV